MTLVRATRSELTKHHTTVMWWVLLIALVGYVGFVAALMAWAFGSQLDSSANADGSANLGSANVIYGLAASVGYVVPLLVGTLLVTNEYRHQTLTPTFLATPRRGTVLSAKVVAGILLGALYGVVGVIASVAPGAGILSLYGAETLLGEPDTWALLARVILAFVLWVLIGVGLGSLISNQIGAVIGILVFTLFVEPILLSFQFAFEWLADILKYLPGAATNTLVGESLYTLGADPSTLDPWWTGAGYLLGYAVLFLLLGYLLRWRRDIN